MIGALSLAIALTSIESGTSSTPDPVIESWTCTVKEQLDPNVSGMLEMLVYPDGVRRELSYYVNWAQRPGYMAEQQMSWVWIPLDAALLWKPDNISFSVKSERTDEKGSVNFAFPTAGSIRQPARGMVRSLRPTFQTTWVSASEGYLVARLWAAWPWEAQLSDRKGAALGSQAILLPRPEIAQAMFKRLRTELDRIATQKATKCTANPEIIDLEEVI